jgi:two-component system cell cycle response regulator CtrA
VRILHIEDDATIAMMVAKHLQQAGFTSDATDLGEEGVDLAKRYAFDAVICDGHLPDMSGLEVVRALRRARIPTPVMMLSGDNDLAHKVATFRAGADEFMSKPYHADELIARLHAIVRRSKGFADPEIVIGPLSIDVAGKAAKVDGRPVHLTGKEYGVLEALAVRVGQVLTKDALMDHVYGGRDEPHLKIIDVFMCKLRRKLSDASPGCGALIETVWGRGYRITASPKSKEAKLSAPPQAGLSEKIIVALGRGPRPSQSARRSRDWRRSASAATCT